MLELNDQKNEIDPCAPCVADALLPTKSENLPELATRLEKNYPLTVAAFRKMEGGLSHLQYVTALEERWKKVSAGHKADTNEILRYVRAWDLPIAQAQFDIVYCGGVLGLFSAAVMARKGYKVAVLDQRRVGTSHREWNISDEELGKFVEAGLFSRSEIEQAVAGRYEQGLVKFHAGDIPEKPAELWLKGVLDVAIDLGKLLEMARQKFEAAGGICLDYRALQRVYITRKGAVRATVEVINQAGAIERYGSRLVVNALGAISPLSLILQDGKPFDGVCPTVGTTASGFKVGTSEREVNLTSGDILVTIAHAQKNRQLIWEGFPGRDGEMTTYLFYYDLVGPELAAEQSLLDLFEAYFELLDTYKDLEPNFRHLKPVYGYIPARHHRKLGSASRRGIISVGDATSPQSALTFCGFGSQVRNLPRLTRLLEIALDSNLLEEKHLRQIGAHQSNISLVWFFSRFMQPVKPAARPADVNRLMNSFCRVLNQVGPEVSRRFFQDKSGLRDYLRLLLMTAARSPRVLGLAFETLSGQELSNWGIGLFRFSREALYRHLYRRFQKPLLKLEKQWSKTKPAWALALAARREEWQAAGLL